MAIFLSILKIIGIILLSVLGLIIALILMVLFVPIRYRLKGVMPESAEGTEVIAKVTYLLHIISVCFTYKDKKTELSVRILGIPIRRNKDNNKENKKNKKNKKDAKKTDEPEKTETYETIRQQELPLEQPQYTIETWEDCRNREFEEFDTEPEELDIEAKGRDTESEQLDPEPDRANGFWGKICDFVRIIKEFCKKTYQTVYNLIHNTEKTIKRISSEVEFYSRYVQDERNKNAFSKCIFYLKKILKSVKPRRIKGNINFGMENPAATGQVLMYMSLIYPVMPRKLNINPDFEKKILEGDIYIKGRVLILVMLWSAVRIYFDRDVKRALRIMKRHREK